MIKQTVTYEDFNGNQVSEDLYFNLSKSEVIDLETSEEGSLSSRLTRVQKSNDVKAMYREIRGIILLAYGVKSEDGRKFQKSDQILSDFESSAAFDQFVWDLFTSTDTIVDFVNGIVDSKALKEARELQEKRKINLDEPEKPTAPVKPENSAEPEVGTFGQPLEEDTVKTKEPTPDEMKQKLKDAGLL